MSKRFSSLALFGGLLLATSKPLLAQINTSEINVEQRSNTAIEADLIVGGNIITQGSQTVSGTLTAAGHIYGGVNKSIFMQGLTANWGLRSYCGLTAEYDAATDENFSKIVHWGLGRGGFRFYAHQGYFDTSPTKVAEISRFGVVSGASDRRLKEDNIAPLSSALQKIRGLQGVNYTWKNDAEKVPTAGFIAQDVYEQIPEAVNKPSNPEDTWTMQITPIVAYLVEAMKELDQEVKQLHEENIVLKERLADFEKKSLPSAH